MEHLMCHSPEDLWYFINVTKMEIVSVTYDTIILKGESTFKYVYDIHQELFCFKK